MWSGILIIAASIASLIFHVLVDRIARGAKTTHVMTVSGFSENLNQGGISNMKPKDLLAFLEKGDRTMEDLRSPKDSNPYSNVFRGFNQSDALGGLSAGIGSLSNMSMADIWRREQYR